MKGVKKRGTRASKRRIERRKRLKARNDLLIDWMDRAGELRFSEHLESVWEGCPEPMRRPDWEWTKKLACIAFQTALKDRDWPFTVGSWSALMPSGIFTVVDGHVVMHANGRSLEGSPHSPETVIAKTSRAPELARMWLKQTGENPAPFDPGSKESLIATKLLRSLLEPEAAESYRARSEKGRAADEVG